ncbi:unnamed protein product [Bathycoccus prasinos]
MFSLTGRLKSFPVFLVCKRLVPLSQPAPKQSFTPGKFIIYRCASTHFEENQLAPSSIGISPLTITHPSIFQHRSVRTSTSYHQSFILVVVRSPGFGSRRRDEYLVLRGGPREFIRDFTCPILLGSQTVKEHDSTTGLSPSMVQVSAVSFLILVPFRSPLLWESLLLSFPSATKMFQFTELTFSSL